MADTPTTNTTILSTLFNQKSSSVSPISNADVLKDANNISRLVKSFSAHQEQKEQAAETLPPTLTGPTR